MNSSFGASFFENNRKAILESSNCDLIIVAANTTLQRNGDGPYLFRQDSNFWYLCGIEKPDFVLVFNSKQSFLIAPELTKTQLIFDPQQNWDDIKKTSGVTKVYECAEGWQKLHQLIDNASQIGIPAPPSIQSWGVTANPSQDNIIKKVKKLGSSKKVKNIIKTLAHSRMVKKPEELVAIQRAIDITTDAIAQITRDNLVNKYSAENEIEADLSYWFRKGGAQGHAFNPVIAGGKNATAPHYQLNNDKLSKNSLVVLDVGAEVCNYAADITRTIAYGKLSQRQTQVLESVISVQQKAIKRIKPGLHLDESERMIEKDMGIELKKLGLITATKRTDIRQYYGHAASHMLGLDTHDLADYSLPLKENMVLTVEPGIYIPEENIGVRIEDDVLVTKDGCKVLSKNLPVRLS